MNTAKQGIAALRNSHDLFTALVTPLSPEQLESGSYATEWSIAQTASHLGSQAEIFGLFLEAALTGAPAPGNDVFGPIWESWNTRTPAQQAADTVAANEKLLARLEGLVGADLDLGLSMFGMEIDLSRFVAMKLAEHALHTWDIAVVLDPAATVAHDAVELLIDGLPQLAARAGKPHAGLPPMLVETARPGRRFLLTASPEVTLQPADESRPAPSEGGALLALPAEAFVRLVYGRLDPAHVSAGVPDDPRLADLRQVFVGF